MKKLYLILSVIGFVLPNIFTVKVSFETGNWLFLAMPFDTLNYLTANDTVKAFTLDLVFGALVFFVWVYYESQRLGIKHPWLYWLLTILFGIAGTLPLFLYIRSGKTEEVKNLPSQ